MAHQCKVCKSLTNDAICVKMYDNGAMVEDEKGNKYVCKDCLASFSTCESCDKSFFHDNPDSLLSEYCPKCIDAYMNVNNRVHFTEDYENGEEQITSFFVD